MKSIKQIADEIGVSKQAVFYRIKKPPLSNNLQSLTQKCEGVLMVSKDGEMLIKQAFCVDASKSFGVKEPSNKNISFDGEIIKLLQDNIEILQEQLKIKDKQIEILTDTIKAQAHSINANNQKALAETIIEGQQFIGDSALPTDEPGRKERKKWWQFNK